MSISRRSRKFWKSVIIIFLIYFLIVPAVYFILDSATVIKSIKGYPFRFILEMAGIALGIALILALWTSRDPELKKW